MTTTYLFYDIETTGLNKCFDQVLQFAAIRTDTQFNELERHEIQVKLNNDVVPSPTAVKIHHIGPDQFQQGLNELEAMQKIHALLNVPGTRSVGYNSLGFDDEFLRFSFYRNLLSPYTHQYANQCGRFDIYPITVLYYLFKNEILTWPDQNLKLENINACNQLADGASHNAMVDVEATLALAKKLSQDKTIWDFVLPYFQKTTDADRVASCDTQTTIQHKNYKIGVMVDGKFGNEMQYLIPVIELGSHFHYKNQTMWLRLDTENLRQTKSDTILETTWAIRKRLSESPLFLPMKSRYIARISEQRQTIMADNLKWLENNPALFHTISQYHLNYKYPEVLDCDPDAALYLLDFPTVREENQFRAFHAAAPEKKEAIALQFPNPIRRTQALRIMGRHFFDVLSEEGQAQYHKYLSEAVAGSGCIVDFRGEKKLTVDAALLELEDVGTELVDLRACLKSPGSLQMTLFGVNK
ncbi:MAG: hypothetical protein A3I77_01215 [Gammaproteobacteria bacterium RIFCSPLOWO2_02_FULL_42_14]|nr:MAG: hypothetical protein A3B71_07400 [Gammaproteobacteria bacterium RIFCSPHIGHO2_02_FULL_42_43]OGT52249.1 MAG: hypothetical protein A3E54_01275 [Gammaproteobacteria bacterium RIFCSPHIGHO2_12_FULL_41_25]OGT61862.1 MAG: hypothetical protein A3I77_01215 [Gammaproteobacteria bacterium RIFCSPLOWO2_02_FULL_42_14]OGT86427.1 MAG: hypothetical protein A3G86_07875 [Gammaproteobacteria bacterium RIFCSPLOWO2_12_FULL_42_18]